MAIDIQTSPQDGSFLLVPHKLYIGILTQFNELNPTVNEYANSIGDIAWARTSIGHYEGTLDGAFVTGKTVTPPFGSIVTAIPLYSSQPGDYFYNFFSNDPNKVFLSVYDAAGADVELSDVGSPIYIEIRVYQ